MEIPWQEQKAIELFDEANEIRKKAEKLLALSPVVYIITNGKRELAKTVNTRGERTGGVSKVPCDRYDYEKLYKSNTRRLAQNFLEYLKSPECGWYPRLDDSWYVKQVEKCENK